MAAQIQKIAAVVFILAVAILSVVSVFGIWKFLEGDVINKSFETLWLLAFVAVIVIVASRFVETRIAAPAPVPGTPGAPESPAPVPALPDPLFPQIRKATIAFLIVAVSLLALCGVLAIWDVFSDKEVLYRSIGSLFVLAFGAFLIVLTCLERERTLGHKNSSGSILGIIALMVFVYFVFAFTAAFR